MGNVFSKHKYFWQAVMLNSVAAFCTMIYFMITDRGILHLSYDFNAQEMVFGIFANREIKEGDIFFNWAIDMGSAFIPSFSFYNLGSPFFWITLFFKPETFPYLTGWIMMLKYAAAGVTAYLYLKNNLEKKSTAVLFSVMYAFSGYQACSVIFYHFQDVVALFPLLLIGLDHKIRTDKKGYMALAVGLNALVNWNFFIGEVFFLIVYYLLRYKVVHEFKKGNAKEQLSRILGCFAEGVLGVGISAALFIPSAIAIMGSSRVSDHIQLSDAFFFDIPNYLQLLRALILPADIMSEQTAIMPQNWYSNATYLPMVGLVLIFAFFTIKDPAYKWVRNILVISLVTAAVPVLNSVFVMFNWEPYRRWLYMPVLMMTLASAVTYEKMLQDQQLRTKIKKSAVIYGIIVLVFTFVVTEYKLINKESGVYSDDFYQLTLIAFVGAMLVYLMMKIRDHRKLYLCLMLGTCAFAILTNMRSLKKYRVNNSFISSEIAYAEMIKTCENLEPDILPYRYRIDDAYYNRNMAHSIVSQGSFISTVENGIFEFYDALGEPRHALSLDGPAWTWEMQSVKYLVTEKKYKQHKLVDQFNNGNRDVYVYELVDSAPIGFTYDEYITEEELADIDQEHKAKAMISALVVKSDDEAGVSNVLEHRDVDTLPIDTADVKAQAADRRRESSSEFTHDGKSFTSTITADADKYAFFSVAYSKFWSAKVNGEEVDILDASGMMAVPVTAGVNHIEFHYSITYIVVSFVISLLSLLAVISMMVYSSKVQK